MSRLFVVIALWSLGFFTVSAQASFPSRITVQFKNKMSCRDVRKMLKPIHLHVNCQFYTVRSSEYSAEYFGQEPLPKVMSDLAANSKIQGVASGEEALETLPQEKFLAPVRGSIN